MFSLTTNDTAVPKPCVEEQCSVGYFLVRRIALNESFLIVVYAVGDIKPGSKNFRSLLCDDEKGQRQSDAVGGHELW